MTRGEFIRMMTRNHPENPLFPLNPDNLSQKELFNQTLKKLQEKGFHVLQGKQPDKPMTDVEFVRLAYAFTGAPSGKNLFEQKLHLKNAGIIKTTDIGLATGVDGRVFQFHQGQVYASKTFLGAPVFMDDRVKTFVKAKAAFTFDDGSNLILGENAVVHITKYIYDPDKNFRQTVVKVSLGAVRFLVAKSQGANSSFKVITPVVAVGVRGTEFVVNVEPGGKTTIVGIENEVATLPLFQGKRVGQQSILGAGQMQTISEKGQASAVKPASPEVIQQIRAQTESPRIMASNEDMIRYRVEDEGRAIKAAFSEPSAPGLGEKIGTKAATDAVKDAASQAAEEAQNAAQEAVREAQNAAQEAVREAQNAAQEAAQEAAGDAVGDAKSGLKSQKSKKNPQKGG